MAGSTDIARLMLQVDASTEIARRNMRDLARAIEKDGGDIEKALQRVEAGHARMGQQLQKAGGGQFRSGMQQLSFQIGDVSQQMTLGVAGSRIFVQQSGQVIQALQLMAAESSGFLRFLSGPWGVALLTAGTVLVTMAGKLFETRDAVGQLVDKMREQANQARANEQANAIWERSLDGIIDKTRKLREEQGKQLQTDREAQQQQLTGLQGDNRNASGFARRTEKELAEAQRRLQVLRQQAAQGGVGAKGAVDRSQLTAAEAEVKRLTGELAKAQSAVQSTAAAIANLQVLMARGDAAALSDPIEKIRRKYEDLRRAAERAAQGNEKLRKSLAGTLAEFNRREAAEIKAQQGSNNAANRQSGRQVDGPGAAAIARAAGLQVNSVNRSYGQQKALYDAWVAAGKPKDNPVAPPGSSAHEGAKGKWALDIQITDGVTPAKIRKIYADKGVSLSKVLKERGHLHIEGSRGDAAAAESAQERADRDAKRAADKKTDQDDAFAGEVLQLDQQLLQAQMELVQGVQAQADFAKAQVDLEQGRYEQSIQNSVNDGRLREEQGKLLVEKSQAVTLQKKANIDARGLIDRMEEQRRNLAQESDFRLEALRYQEEMARTAREKRDVELQIIAALYAQREADLKIAKAKAAAVQNWEEAARIQREIDQLPVQRGRDESRAQRNNQGPMEQWADGIPQTAEEMDEFFEKLKVQGINGAIDALMALGDGFESFRDTAINAIKAVLAELLRMQLMKLALNIFGGAVSGGFGGGAAMAPVASDFTGALVGGAGLSDIGFLYGAASGMVGTIGGRGGVDQNVLSINGRPQLRVSAGETLAVIPQASQAALPAPFKPGDSAGSGANARSALHIGSVHISVPGASSDKQARRTGTQAARAFQREIARAAERG